MLLIASELRCLHCGSLWYTDAAREMLERGEMCLDCDGALELVPDEDRQDIRRRGDAPPTSSRQLEEH